MGEPLPDDFTANIQSLVLQLLDKDPSKRPGAHELLMASAFKDAAAAAAARHNLSWPPVLGLKEAHGQSRSGLVKRLRGHVNGSASAIEDDGDGPDDEVVYSDDFEDELDYGDDFEEASDSGASYEADFEEPSDDGGGEEDAAEIGKLDELSETQVRLRIREELGEEALAAAEKFGLISFLGAIGSAGSAAVAQ